MFNKLILNHLVILEMGSFKNVQSARLHSQPIYSESLGSGARAHVILLAVRLGNDWSEHIHHVHSFPVSQNVHPPSS